MPQYNQFVVNTWESYDVGSAYSVSREILERAVSRAAKAANSRLRRLERKGETRNAYARAMRNLDGRSRFYEYTKNKTLGELRTEYGYLRDFLSSKSSTIQGLQSINYNRYRTAVENGFTGTIDEFNTTISQVFSKYAESLFSSDVLYKAVTSGYSDVIMQVVERYRQSIDLRKQESARGLRGRALRDYLKMRRK